MAIRDRRLELAGALIGGTPVDLRHQLDATEVAVRLGPDPGPVTLRAAAAVVSMAARVVGNVVAPPVDLPRPNPWRSATLSGVAGIGRGERPRSTYTARTFTVGVGLEAGRADFYLGGDDWTAVVSRRRPVEVGVCPLGGLGVQAAAALAFGEVLKDLLGPVGMRCVRVEDDLVWNLFDGQLGPARLPRSRPKAAQGVHGAQRGGVPGWWSGSHPLVALLGVGSVGSSTAALLSMLPDAGGAVDVVDPDSFDPRRNAYRCAGVPAAEAGPKSDWAARLLRGAGWAARPHRLSIAEWAEARGEPGFPGLALVSVDNVDGRRDASQLLAATTVSAGVAGASLHVHRHLATDGLACPYCEFVDVARWRRQAVVYARLGLTRTRLQALLEGATLTMEDIGTAIWTGAVDHLATRDLAGGRLVDLLERHYATVATHPDDRLIHRVAAPHVTWLAGVLLAAEVVKAAAGLRGLERRVELDLTGVPLGGWRRPARDPSGRCPCTDPARSDLARSLYDT